LNGFKRDCAVLVLGLLLGCLGSSAGYFYTAGNRLTRIETILENQKSPPDWFKERVDNHIGDPVKHHNHRMN